MIRPSHVTKISNEELLRKRLIRKQRFYDDFYDSFDNTFLGELVDIFFFEFTKYFEI